MKNIFTYIQIYLAAFLLVGCQKEEPATADNGPKLTTVYAYINNELSTTRVAYEDNDGVSLKVNWKEQGEQFIVNDGGSLKLFSQQQGGAFVGEELTSETPIAYYPAKAFSTEGYSINFSAQTGQLNEKFGLMLGTTTNCRTFDFNHMTAIIKPAFRISGQPADSNVNNTIDQITLYGVKNVVNMATAGNIHVNCNNLDDIYIYLPTLDKSLTNKIIYGVGDKIDLLVNIDGKSYTGRITVPADHSIECGKIYKIGITLTLTTASTMPDGEAFKEAVESFIRGKNITTIEFLAGEPNASSGTQIPDTDIYLHQNGSTLEIQTSKAVFKFGANSCYKMFSGLTAVTTINFNNCVDTSSVTSMYHTFYNCQSLASVDLSCFNTENVANMNGMFHYCYALESVNLSSFDTRAATTMKEMFHSCTSLTALDLSNFNTDNVTNMQYLFSYCKSLETLDIRNFNMDHMTDVTSYSSMIVNVGNNFKDTDTKTQIYLTSAVKAKIEGQAIAPETNVNFNIR